MGNIVLISGGTKSGKSDFAEYLARKKNNIIYIALSEIRNNDNEWQKKINEHKKRRPKHWRLIETVDLIEVLKNETDVLLVDSIGGFIVNTLKLNDNAWNKVLKKLINRLNLYTNEIIIVAEQTGWGLVSEHKVGNKFIERLGETLKEITKISNENWLTINGKAIKLDDIFFEI